MGMEVVKVRKVRPDAIIPKRASNGAVGYDVFASIRLDPKTKEAIGELPVTVRPGKKALIGIGVQIALPWPWEAEVRPRSGLATVFDMELGNSPGTVDPDFRGEAGVLLRNRGNEGFTIEKDMRIAQFRFNEAKIPVLELVDVLPPTLRGAGGFGSTGLFQIREGTDQYEAEIRKFDVYFMKIAVAASDLSACVRGCRKSRGGKYLVKCGKLVGQTRKFGCVIVKDGNIVGHGYNAQEPGSPCCALEGCLRDAKMIKSGTRIEECRALHAEWWAFANILKNGGPGLDGATMYLNAEPCRICARFIARVGIKCLVVLKGTYPNNGLKYLADAGVAVRYVEI